MLPTDMASIEATKISDEKDRPTSMEETKYFCYSSKDFIFQFPRVSSGSGPLSRFDERLCQAWNNAQDKGYFRYKLDKLQTRILPGRYSFVVQLNEKRAVERRKPQEIMSVSQPFNPDLFNFTKVSEREILFEMKRRVGAACSCMEQNEPSKHLMVINVSPLGYGNCLLVPFVSSRLPQVLTVEAVAMGVELVLLSRSHAFRVGFNTLCANASVNHQHLHMYYLEHKLYLESATLSHLAGGWCFEICDYVAPGFAFCLSKEEGVQRLAERVFKVADYLQRKNIPLNMFVTRGSGNVELCSTMCADTVRVFLWARKPVYGIKDDMAFNVACCELAGHVLVKQAASFETVTEHDVCQELQDSCAEMFFMVRQELIDLVNNLNDYQYTSASN